VKLFRRNAGGDFEAVSLPDGESVALGGIARVVLVGDRLCVLLAGDGVVVNGHAALQLTVLMERDEIRARGETYYVGGNEAAVVDFTANDSKTCCARCKCALVPGDRVINCPGCSSVHHAPCWGYAPHCAGCDRMVAGEWRPH
jgi:hypothetical protein